jgi:hypothetical protein
MGLTLAKQGENRTISGCLRSPPQASLSLPEKHCLKPGGNVRDKRQCSGLANSLLNFRKGLHAKLGTRRHHLCAFFYFQPIHLAERRVDDLYALHHPN